MKHSYCKDGELQVQRGEIHPYRHVSQCRAPRSWSKPWKHNSSQLLVLATPTLTVVNFFWELSFNIYCTYLFGSP